MKLALICLLGLALVSGCGSDVNPRSQTPAEVYTSKKAAKSLVQCLLPALSAGYSRQLIGHAEFEQHMVDAGEYDLVPSGQLVYGHYTFTVNVKQGAQDSAVAFYFDPISPKPIISDVRTALTGCL